MLKGNLLDKESTVTEVREQTQKFRRNERKKEIRQMRKKKIKKC